MFDAANDLNLEEKCVCSKTYLSRHDGRERGRAEAKMKAPVDVLKREGCGKKKKKVVMSAPGREIQSWENC